MSLRRCIAAWMLGWGAFNANAAAEPVTLAAGTEPVPLAGHIEVLREVNPTWTLDDVRKPENAARFTAMPSDYFNLGYSDKASWFRMTLRNPEGSAAMDWVLEFGLGVLDYVDVHLSRSDGRTETSLTGDRRHRPPNQLGGEVFAIPLAIAAGETVSLHVRLVNAAVHLGGFTLWTEAAYREKSVAYNLRGGMILGFFLALLAYNLLIGLWARDRAYLLLALAIFSATSVNFTFSGAARDLGNEWFDAAPSWISGSVAFFLALVPLTFLLFSREFLQTRLHAPRLDLALRILTGSSALVLLLFPLLSYRLVVQLAIAQYFLVPALLLPTALFLLLRRGLRTAGFYLLSFGLIGAAYILSNLFVIGGISDTSPLLLFVTPIAGGLGTVLLSLALADRVLSERRERERLERMKNFFAPQVAEAILDEGGASLLAPKRREVTVVFTDLRGFTALAAQSEPEDVIRVLREYHEAVVETTAKHGGNVEHIAGDGVMVYFNAPIEVSEPEVRAVRMAFDLRAQFEALYETWKKRGHELGVGIGMACGYATVGAVGAKGRMDYSCIGTVTNLAARLCAISKHGQILAPQQLVNRLESLVKTEALGEQDLKGMPKPVTVFNLLAATGTNP